MAFTEMTVATYADLFVGNLSPDVDERRVWEAFATFGAIREVTVKRSSKGNFGYVNFIRTEDAERAVRAMDGALLGRFKVQVSLANFNKPFNPGNEIRVHGLPYVVTRTKLYEMFACFGEITRVDMKNDRDTGRPLGLGFVGFARHQDAERAIAEMNGYELDGRWLHVEWSRDARKAQACYQSQEPRPSTNQPTPVPRGFPVSRNGLSSEQPAVASASPTPSSGSYATANPAASREHLSSVGPKGHELIVTCLPYDMGRSQFYALFLRFEGMTRCDLINEPRTRRMLGYGFVGYKRFEDAEKALEEMDGYAVGGRPIRVAWTRQSRPKGFDVKVINMLDPNVDRRILKEFFAHYGDIRRAEVDYDRFTGEPAGFAFITFATNQQAEAAVKAFDGRAAQDGTMIVNWFEGKLQRELECIRTEKDEPNGYKEISDAQLIDFSDDPTSTSSSQNGGSALPMPLNFGHRLVHSLTDSWTSVNPAPGLQGLRLSAASSIEILSEPAPSSSAYNPRLSPSPLGDTPISPAMEQRCSNLVKSLTVHQKPLSLWPIPDEVAYVYTESQRRIPLRFFAVDEDQMKDTIADILLMDSQGTDAPDTIDSLIFKTTLVVPNASDVPAFTKAVVSSGFDAFTCDNPIVGHNDSPSEAVSVLVVAPPAAGRLDNTESIIFVDLSALRADIEATIDAIRAGESRVCVVNVLFEKGDKTGAENMHRLLRRVDQ